MAWRDILKSRRTETHLSDSGKVAAQTKWGRMANRDWLADVRQLVKAEQPVIVDAGAAGGTMIKRLADTFPGSAIHAFEPLPQRIAQLRERYANQPSITIHPQALGDEARQIAFHISANQDSSSVLETGHISDAYHGEKTATNQTITVEQVRLDDAIDQQIDILKMDLQGYELQALKGATRQLKQMQAIVLEVEFVPLYDNQPLFAEIDQFMRSQQYRLFNLYGLYTQKDGQLTSGDALYLNQTTFGDFGAKAG